MTTQRVRISCPTCAHPLHVRPDVLGRLGLCRFCGSKFRAQAGRTPPAVRTAGVSEHRVDRERDELAARLAALQAELGDYSARLADREREITTALEELEATRSRLSEAETSARVLQSEAADCLRLRGEVESLHGELARVEADAQRIGTEREAQAEEAARLQTQVSGLETTLARSHSQKEAAERSERARHARAEAECIALATEILRLQERLETLESSSETAATEYRHTRELEQIAREELAFANSQLVYERDALARKAAKLRERINLVEASRTRVEADSAGAREQWARDRERLEEDWQERVASLTDEPNQQAERARLEQREDLHVAHDSGVAERSRLEEQLAAALRARADDAIAHEQARTGWETDQTRWRSERVRLLAEADRALRERVEQFEIERRALCERLEAEGRRDEENQAFRQESEGLGRLLDDVRRERDELVQRLQTREDDALRLRAEHAQRDEELDRHERLNEAALASLQESAADAARERDEARDRLAAKHEECAALSGTLAATQGALERGQNSAMAELQKLHALAQETARELEHVQRRLDESEGERAALANSQRDADAAFEAGRNAIAVDVERLRTFAADIVRERDDALRQLHALRRSRSLGGDGPPAVGSPAGQPLGSEVTRQAKSWLDAVLSQVSNADGPVHERKSDLVERLRTVRAALAEASAGGGGSPASPPRPRSEDFGAPAQYRAALTAWLGDARRRRRGAAGQAARLKSEVASVRNEVALLDRDLVLNEFGAEEALAFPFEENENA